MTSIREYKLTTVEVKNDLKIADVEQLNDPKKAANFARKFYGEDLVIYESFFCIFLDNSNNPIGFSKIGQGGINGVMVDKRIILKIALDLLATAVICVHNHPAGSLEASKDDIETTKSISSGLEAIGLTMLDSIIITKESYTSLFDKGVLTK